MDRVWTLDSSPGLSQCASLCCVLGQDTLLLQCLSPLRNVTQYRLITKETWPNTGRERGGKVQGNLRRTNVWVEDWVGILFMLYSEPAAQISHQRSSETANLAFNHDISTQCLLMISQPFLQVIVWRIYLYSIFRRFSFGGSPAVLIIPASFPLYL